MPETSAAVDIAVIGGGVAGLSFAWRAASRGMDVAVYDAGHSREPAARVAAGMLGPVAEAGFGEAGRRLLDLGLESAARWPSFAAELERASGVDCGLRLSGTLVLARDRDEAEALEREIDFRGRRGLNVRRLTGSEARRLEPSLAPAVRMAAEMPGDHSVHTRALLEALRAAVVAAGVALHAASEVAGVEIADSERLRGLRLGDGSRVRAETVVVAAGAWSGSLPGLPERARIPVRPVKGQILRLRDPAGPGLIDHVLRFEGGYLVPRGNGRYVLGATVEERGFDTTSSAGAVRELLREAHALVPGLDELELEELAAGLRPGTPDNLPILGRGAIEGLVWATGGHRNGILLAPLAADLLAATLAGHELGPRERELLEACSAERFARVPA